jgi:hypothetical protein
MAETPHNRTSRIIRPLHRAEVAEAADYAGMYFALESLGASVVESHISPKTSEMWGTRHFMVEEED